MLARGQPAGLEPAPETVNEPINMRAAVLLTFLCLAGCTSLPSVSEQGFVDQAGWRHQQALRDADAILAGMNQARAQSERVAKQAR